MTHQKLIFLVIVVDSFEVSPMHITSGVPDSLRFAGWLKIGNIASNHYWVHFFPTNKLIALYRLKDFNYL